MRIGPNSNNPRSIKTTIAVPSTAPSARSVPPITIIAKSNISWSNEKTPTEIERKYIA